MLIRRFFRQKWFVDRGPTVGLLHQSGENSALRLSLHSTDEKVKMKCLLFYRMKALKSRGLITSWALRYIGAKGRGGRELIPTGSKQPDYLSSNEGFMPEASLAA